MCAQQATFMHIPSDSSIRSLLAERMGRSTPIVQSLALRVERQGRATSLVILIRSDDGSRSTVLEFLGRKVADDLLEAFISEDLPFDDVVFRVADTQTPMVVDADVVYVRPEVATTKTHEPKLSVEEVLALIGTASEEDLV